MTAESFSDQAPATGPEYAHASSPTHSASGLPEASAERNELSGGPGRDVTPANASVAFPGDRQQQQMHEVAERLGGVLGTAIRQARGFSSRVRGGLQVVQGRVADRTSRASQETQEAASRLQEAAKEKAADWNQGARQRFVELRQQAEEMKTEYPLQMILALAAAAFVIGFGIRLWRSTRD